jgi:hypothetical protein
MMPDLISFMGTFVVFSGSLLALSLAIAGITYGIVWSIVQTFVWTGRFAEVLAAIRALRRLPADDRALIAGIVESLRAQEAGVAVVKEQATADMLALRDIVMHAKCDCTLAHFASHDHAEDCAIWKAGRALGSFRGGW